MPWLIDSDILIEGEREHPSFVPWLAAQAEVATADIIRAEFLIGVHAVPQPKRERQHAKRCPRARCHACHGQPLVRCCLRSVIQS